MFGGRVKLKKGNVVGTLEVYKKSNFKLFLELIF